MYENYKLVQPFFRELKKVEGTIPLILVGAVIILDDFMELES